jgi:hypothetical protein
MLSGLPILAALTQIVCLVFCFTFDTPVVMMQNKEEEKVRIFMGKMYKDTQVIE